MSSRLKPDKDDDDDDDDAVIACAGRSFHCERRYWQLHRSAFRSAAAEKWSHITQETQSGVNVEIFRKFKKYLKIPNRHDDQINAWNRNFMCFVHSRFFSRRQNAVFVCGTNKKRLLQLFSNSRRNDSGDGCRLHSQDSRCETVFNRLVHRAVLSYVHTSHVHRSYAVVRLWTTAQYNAIQTVILLQRHKKPAEGPRCFGTTS